MLEKIKLSTTSKFGQSNYAEYKNSGSENHKLPADNGGGDTTTRVRRKWHECDTSEKTWFWYMYNWKHIFTPLY